ncbi:hypothetical protein PIB30_081180 [Stylosanthes scabra]|uniref:Uncharacterized protein n=1 Tax=Stylosanthes scabra TaxID=79078 RepID=A0ABU6RRM7_9FABA|nr:hypothetical protein [Stylosanthes scabra]
MNDAHASDPLINVIINGKLGYVHGIMNEREIIDGRGGVSVFECLNMKGVFDACYIKGVRGELMELDPVLIEDQISATCAEKVKRFVEAHHTQFPLIVFDNDVLKNGPSDPADVAADRVRPVLVPSPQILGPAWERRDEAGCVNKALSVQFGSRIVDGIAGNEEGSSETLYYEDRDNEVLRNLLVDGATPMIRSDLGKCTESYK